MYLGSLIFIYKNITYGLELNKISVLATTIHKPKEKKHPFSEETTIYPF